MQARTNNRGFASMSAEKQREIARKGGKAAHAKGTAHEFTAEEARNAGQKGGQRVSVDRSHMAKIGRLGGKSSAGRRTSAKQQPTGQVGGNGSSAPQPSQSDPIDQVDQESTEDARNADVEAAPLEEAMDMRT